MCARFQADPRNPHYKAVKRIGRYLLQTKDKDFLKAYTKENYNDPNSVKSRSGCVIMYGKCPITWFSKLQSEIALSSTEAEYIALSTAAREVLPL
eukprot:13216466-Ditylum_brightwellii.AAC.1